MAKLRTSGDQHLASSRQDGPHPPAASPLDCDPPAAPLSAPLRDLLAGYLGLLDAVGRLRREARLPRRVWTWATERIATDRVRHGLEELERRYGALRAIGGPLDPQTEEDRERVAELASALPASPSRLRTLWLVVGALVLARVLLGVAEGVLPSAEQVGTLKVAASPSAVALPSFPTSDALTPLVTVVDELASASPANVGRLLDIVFKTNLLATSVMLTILAIALYMVLRPFACGASATRILCQGSSQHRSWSLYGDEHELAASLRIRERESAAFAPIGISPPAGSQVDLLAKACLAASLLAIAVGLWHVFLAGGIVGSEGDYGSGGFRIYFTRVADYHAWYAWVAAAIGSLAVVRLAWLARELHRRQVGRHSRGSGAHRASAPRATLAYAVPLAAVAAAFALYSVPDHRQPSAWVLTTTRVKRALDRGLIKIRFACDEPCHISAARFLRPGRGLARPWPSDMTEADVTDHLGPGPSEVATVVRKFVSSDVVVSGATRTGSVKFDVPPHRRSLWPQLRDGKIVPELRITDISGNSTIVPLWWSYWECELRWRSSLSISSWCPFGPA